MKCRVAEEWLRVRCDGPLGAEAERTLRLHLESCPSCAQEARDLDMLHVWVSDLPLAEPSANFDWRLRLRLSKAEREVAPPLFEGPVLRRRPRLEFWVSAAAAALVVVVTGLHLLRPPDGGSLSNRSASGRVAESSPVRSYPGALVTPVRDGPPVGPQQALPYSSLMFPQQVGPPAPVDTLPASTSSTP